MGRAVPVLLLAVAAAAVAWFVAAPRREVAPLDGAPAAPPAPDRPAVPPRVDDGGRLGADGDLGDGVPGEVAGRVEDADGAPVAGVRVELLRPKGRRPRAAPPPDATRRLAAAATDAAGRFSFADVVRAEVELVVLPDERYEVPSPRPVRKGVRDLRLVLARAARPTVVVLDAAGHAVRTTVEVDDVLAPGGVRRWSTDGDGRAALGGLAARARYRLVVRAPSAEWQTAVRPAWAPADTEVRLEPALRVGGVVVDDDGAPVPDASVWVEGPDGTSSVVSVDAAGRFEVGGVAPGPVRLRAACLADWLPKAAPASAASEVPAGTTSARLVLARSDVVVHVVGAEGEGATVATATLSEVEGDGRARRPVDPQTRSVTFPRVPAGRRCAVFVHEATSGSYGSAPVASAPAEVTVSLQRGLDSPVTVVAPKGVRARRVTATQGDVVVEAEAVAGEARRFLLRGLPPGRWTVVVEGRADGRVVVEGEAEVEAGEPVEVSLDAPSREG